MELAKSMYLWGSIVEPHECDYEDSRDLGLTCIYCNKPVFLVKGKDFYNNKGTRVIAKPYFAHYKKDEESEACELRTQTLEGKEYKTYAVGPPREQRLALYENKYTTLLFWAAQRHIMKYLRKHHAKYKVYKSLCKPKQHLGALRELLRYYSFDEYGEYLFDLYKAHSERIIDFTVDTSITDIEEWNPKSRVIASELLTFASRNKKAAVALYAVGAHFICVASHDKKMEELMLAESIEKISVRCSDFSEKDVNEYKRISYTFIRAAYIIQCVNWYPLITTHLENKLNLRPKAKGFKPK